MIWNPLVQHPNFLSRRWGEGLYKKGLSNKKKKQRDRNRLVNISVQNFLFYILYIYSESFSLVARDWFIGLFLVFFWVLDWMFVMSLW